MNMRCECDDYHDSYTVSVKVPLLISILSLIVYKILQPYILSYLNPYMITKQDIITDMVDF